MMMIAKQTGADEEDYVQGAKRRGRSGGKDSYKEIFPVGFNAKVKDILRGKKKEGKEKDLDFADLNDFRVPVRVFKQYSVVMKGINEECQDMFLTALGIDLGYKRCKIDWESFINIYCLLKFDSSSQQEYFDFMIKVFDPYKADSGIIPREQFESTLHALFKGQFKYIGDTDTEKGMSEDIKRDLVEKGLTTKDGELDIRKFRKGLEDGLVDINIFK